MTRRATMWMAAAGLFTVINLGGAIYAGYLGEQGHSLLHVALTIAGASAMWRIATRIREQAMTLRGLPTEARLEQLQQSIDAVALETERIGEQQRFEAKLRAEKSKEER